MSASLQYGYVISSRLSALSQWSDSLVYECVRRNPHVTGTGPISDTTLSLPTS